MEIVIGASEAKPSRARRAGVSRYVRTAGCNVLAKSVSDMMPPQTISSYHYSSPYVLRVPIDASERRRGANAQRPSLLDWIHGTVVSRPAALFVERIAMHL